jgi:hypothetical protein
LKTHIGNKLRKDKHVNKSCQLVKYKGIGPQEIIVSQSNFNTSVFFNGIYFGGTSASAPRLNDDAENVVKKDKRNVSLRCRCHGYLDLLCCRYLQNMGQWMQMKSVPRSSL